MTISDADIKKFRKTLQEAARPLYFFDDDADGVSSFIQLYQITGEGKGVIVKAGSELKEEFARKVDEYQPDLVIVLDIPDLSQEFIDRVSQKILWLDHHPVLDRKGVEYYNPRKENPEYNRPTSYWAYKIAKKNIWMAMLGCVGDWFIPDFTNKFAKEYPELYTLKNKEKKEKKTSEKNKKESNKTRVQKIKNPDDALFETDIGKLAMVVSFNLKGSVKDSMDSVKVLTRIESPNEILHQTTSRGKYIYKKYSRFNKEYQSIINGLEITDSKLLLYIYKETNNAYSSELSNEILHRYPDKFIIIGREKNDEFKMSLRSKSTKVLPVLTKALKKVTGKGGGHDYACGAVVASSDFDEFIKEIKKQL